jgi:hypothetical protein
MSSRPAGGRLEVGLDVFDVFVPDLRNVPAAASVKSTRIAQFRRNTEPNKAACSFVRYRDPDHVGGHARGLLLLLAELLVRGERRLDDQGLAVADIREVRRELQPVDQLGSGL